MASGWVALMVEEGECMNGMVAQIDQKEKAIM
jgi:hypothetical protein